MTERLPLFPLDLVLFPGVFLPLHIFEPRYRLLMRRCSERESQFGVVLIRSDTEAGKPAVKVPRPDIYEVRSPLVGTFFRAPKPGSPPFAEVGARVTADKTLCIIEAMKVMNEIKAEIEGVVEEVLVNNGEPVEFNQPLFLIRKA